MALSQNWLDRAVGTLAPRVQLKRVRARLATDLLIRNYEGANAGRRTQTWTRQSTDANSANAREAALSRTRDMARDLVRNNPFAESALASIADDAVGWGIVAKTQHSPAQAAWKAWTTSTACDADGRHDFAGLEKLVMRSVARDGEVLVRRRWRLLTDGLPIPIQLQVLEADFLDTFRTSILPNGGRIIQGIEFDAIGTCVAYWLYPKHPGSTLMTTASTIFSPARRIPASEILHVYKSDRPGQVRAVSWFAPVMLRLKDLDEYEDATLIKQKIAACLAVLTTDVDGSGMAAAVANDSTPVTDTIGPGAIINLPPGRDVTVLEPPSVRDYRDYTSATQRAIAAGLGVTYEDMTGDYTKLPFSAARMSRMRHQRRVEDWRWRMLIPQFCDPAFGWAMEALAILGTVTDRPTAQWTAPALPMVDPEKEGLAAQRLVRSGLSTLSDEIRARGYDPDEVLDEIAADNAKLDARHIVLDSDPRLMTQAGQLQTAITKIPVALKDEENPS